MHKYIITVLAGIVVAGGLASYRYASAHEALPANPNNIREPEENRSIAIFEAPLNPNLPSVLIIGDSVSISYTLPVRQRLEGVANVIRPVANCESTLTILEKLDHWIGQTKWAVIHFNAGLHDLEHVQSEGVAPGKQIMVPVEKGPRWVSVDSYRSNLEKIVARLKKTGAKLVFATTTPVPEGAKSRVPEDVARYNEAALAVMREQGVQIDDLNSAVVDSAYRFQKPQDVHFYQEGSDILADRVAASIKASLIGKRDGSKDLANSDQTPNTLKPESAKSATASNS
ncbi:MAG TPA: SGNH/GDSL hydrolase family protein [Methylocella sp.]|nr:SGNH/GDSL hydrolase family protein [Methylocella sp.]